MAFKDTEKTKGKLLEMSRELNYKDWKGTDVRAYLETNEDWGGPGDWTYAARFELPDGTRVTINELGVWYAPADSEDSVLYFGNDYEDEDEIRDEVTCWLHLDYSKAYSLGEWDEATQSFKVTGPDKRIISNE